MTRGEGRLGGLVVCGQGGLPRARGQALYGGQQQVGRDQRVGLTATSAACQLLKRNLKPKHNQPAIFKKQFHS